jgi:hypothetical protein
MLVGGGGGPNAVLLTLYTDAFVVRGQIPSRHRRVTDILNSAEEPFLVLHDVTTDEFGTKGETIKAEYAQVNLATVLFAVVDTPIDPMPELRSPKIEQQARIAVPPFRIVGNIHLLPIGDARAGLTELQGLFIPVTDATFWSDSLGEARQTALVVAINHARAQILTPHVEVDPWAGLGLSTPTEGEGDAGEPSPPTEPPPDDLGW